MDRISSAAVRSRLFASNTISLHNRLKGAAAALGVASLVACPASAGPAAVGQTYWSGNQPIMLSEGPSCQNISNLTVSLHVTQDMWAIRTGQDVQGQQANGGFTFQLNASPKQYGGKPPVFWMQYIIVLKNNRAFAFFQYFDKAGTYAQPNPGQNSTIMASNALPAGNMIPAGYVLTIALTNDTAGNVTGATLGITDNAGKTSSFSIPSAREALPSYGRAPSNNYILSPFASVGAPIVGPLNWDTSTFQSGAGYITYSVPNGQQLVHEQPKTCGFTSTGEKSNASYGMISPSTGSTIMQPMTTPFAGALASNMDPADNLVQVYHFTQYPPNGTNNNNGDFYLNQFAFNGAWSTQDVTATAGIPAATLGSAVIAYQNTLSKTPEAYYFAATAQGGQEVEQLEGKAWAAKSLSTLTGATPPVLGSGLAGYVDPTTGSDNVVYQGVDQHLHLLTKPSGARWKEEPGAANTPVVAFASAITAHMTAGSEEIFYIGADQHIYEVWRWTNNFDGWHTSDLTQAASTAPVAIGSPLVGFDDPTQKAGDLVFFVGTDRHIHQYAFGNGQWTTTDLTAKANAQPVGYGSALAAHLNRATDSQEIFFVNADQTLEKISSSNGGRPVWTSTNLTNVAGGPTALASPGTPLAVDVNAISKTDELYFVGIEGGLHLLSSPGNGQWTTSTP
jgi:hypothetical protein